MTAPTGELCVVEFGPKRGIGLAVLAKAGVADFPGLWQKQLFPRAAEITRPEEAAAFGVCRCVPGAVDGSFEYVALLEATADAAIPTGMVAVDIPRAHYAVFEAVSLAALGAVWRQVPQAMAAQTAWEPYCGPQGCRCAAYPSFEYHPWDSHQTGQVFVYVSVRRA